jgi:hypothetical protein
MTKSIVLKIRYGIFKGDAMSAALVIHRLITFRDDLKLYVEAQSQQHLVLMTKFNEFILIEFMADKYKFIKY